MPHFIIEHGNALNRVDDKEKALQLAADCGASCGFINPDDIKVRLIPVADFLALDGRRSFIHITVRVLEGRTDEKKGSLSESLRELFDENYPEVESISIDIIDMNANAYKKRLITRT